jgi:hypothetical protein
MPEDRTLESPAERAPGPATTRSEAPPFETKSTPRSDLEGYSLETLSALVDP